MYKINQKSCVYYYLPSLSDTSSPIISKLSQNLSWLYDSFCCITLWRSCHLLELSAYIWEAHIGTWCISCLNSIGVRIRKGVGIGNTLTRPSSCYQSIELNGQQCLTSVWLTLQHLCICPPQLLCLLSLFFSISHRYLPFFHVTLLNHFHCLAWQFCLFLDLYYYFSLFQCLTLMK